MPIFREEKYRSIGNLSVNNNSIYQTKVIVMRNILECINDTNLKCTLKLRELEIWSLVQKHP